ncbi:ExbD/TolR family protein [Parafilimonas terrae]|uniref:Biopolymer transport protein ExbD n=1 Tax=Parafilimonas terrae TaxID=1465490 RepID=A0A1I5Z9I2_9BACT|nr:biopolymer transporter ExbD [Parafilimonas terrae]SFQ53122.1 Biopolymer transport protein ExbD [Parafilimonas terrae]
MADILPAQHLHKAGVRKTKKTSLRVDLTPMVDLGFLLIAFFVFTTTIQQSTSMKLALPDDTKPAPPSLIPENKTLNILLGANNDVYVYNGTELNNERSIGSGTTVLRDAILDKKAAVRKDYGTDSGMVVLIKPTPASTYADVVRALDEMLICNIRTYVLMDASDEELKKVNE